MNRNRLILFNGLLLLLGGFACRAQEKSKTYISAAQSIFSVKEETPDMIAAWTAAGSVFRCRK